MPDFCDFGTRAPSGDSAGLGRLIPSRPWKSDHTSAWGAQEAFLPSFPFLSPGQLFVEYGYEEKGQVPYRFLPDPTLPFIIGYPGFFKPIILKMYNLNYEYNEVTDRVEF